MKELSIFVDESGDFGGYEKHSPHYIITMVLHDQSHDITYAIRRLNSALSRSEQLLFHSKRDLKKDFLKGIHKKEFS